MRQLAILLLLGAGACRATDATDGRILFEQTCARCHGKDGKGDPRESKRLGVPDLTAAELHARLSDEAIVRAIRKGTPGGRMPAFGSAFTEAQVREIVAHVRKLGGHVR